NDVRVPDTARIGEVDGGWRVMTASLQDEHTTGYGARVQRLLEEAETWAKESGRLAHPDVPARLAQIAAEVEGSPLLQRRGVWMAGEGIVPEAGGPMSKLYSSEAFARASQDLFELLGPDALRSYFDPSAPVHGWIEYAVRFALGTRIYAGTSEVQRNIV